MKDELPTFNLVRDPWISCLMLDGQVRELSLREAFEQSHQIRRLAGELPTQDYAVLRILLAVAYRAMPEVRDPVEYWQQLQADPAEVRSLVLEYLAEWEHRFELFHGTAPFMQVADLHTQSGKTDGVSRLIPDIPSGHQYFTTRAGRGLDSLDFGEAARWLIHVHAFDASGIKSGAVGDDRVTGGRGYPIGTGWAGNTGGVYFEGSDLGQTLLLNLDLRYVAQEDSGNDLPVWERPPLGSAVEDREASSLPTGPVDVLSWPNRRVRLFPDNGKVTRVLISNGDPLPPQNMMLDPMTAYRYSKPQTAKLKTDVYMPKQHDRERVIWRGIGSLLAQGAGRGSAGIQEVLPPLIVQWLSMLKNVEVIDSQRVFNARLVGAVYGTQSSVVDEIIDDSLAVHIGLLSDKSLAIANVVKSAATETESAVWSLGTFAGELSRAAGGDSESPRDVARQNAFFDLDEPYRQWVSVLTGQEDPDDARELWNQKARTILRAKANELIAFAGPAAVIGRIQADGQLLTAATAERWLMSNLRKVLPLRTELELTKEKARKREGVKHD